MDRRRESRVNVDQSVKVTALNDGNPSVPLPGRLVDITGTGMQLALPRPLRAGLLVSIDGPEKLYLGEVIYCVLEGEDWRVGVQVEQALRHTEDLKRLRESLLEISEPVRSGRRASALEPVDKDANDTMKVSPHGSRELRFKEDR